MRLVQVAKVLGMTGQDLRKELLSVNFGVKPTDREVPDGLARGIVRFIAQKHGITVDMDVLFGAQDMEEGAEETTTAESSVTTEPGVPEQKPQEAPPVAAPPKTSQAESLHVLRKLTLEGVSKESIAKEQKELKRVQSHEGGAGPRLHRSAVKTQKRQQNTGHQEQIKRKEGIVPLPDQISVKEFAEKTGVQVPLIIQTLMKNGVLATITQSIDYDTAAIVATELGVEVQRETRAAKAEDLLSKNLKELLKDDPEHLSPRPPIVVVMGHVDHGKTAILDAIRKTDVVSEEAGGITQHIGAYQMEHPVDGKPRRITFLDTPGHEAFTAMRSRGAQVTDIAVIVVSAEEGVKPTTVEAINHAKEAGVPVIVAINKIDKERADPDRVKGELAAQGLQPEEWGGQTPVVLTSAVTKQGIPDLLDHIILLADLQGITANPDRLAVATVIESHLDASHGPLATVIVMGGTLRIGDVFLCGTTLGKVKAMMDAHGARLDDVAPSGAVRVSGFDGVPRVGDILQVVPSDKESKALLDSVLAKEEGRAKRGFADLVSRLSEGKLTQLKIVLKADAQGSLEAIQASFEKLNAASTGVSAKVIHAAVGAVSESDVTLAAASDGIVLSFHADVPVEVRRTADREDVKIREYTILYELLDEVDRLMKGLVEPEEKETVFGHLEVKGVFFSKKSEQIIGGRVSDGVVKRVLFRLLREGKEIGSGRITSLKHVDKDIKEAKEGQECGMRVETSVPVLEGDVLEVYVREFKRKET